MILGRNLEGKGDPVARVSAALGCAVSFQAAGLLVENATCMVSGGWRSPFMRVSIANVSSATTRETENAGCFCLRDAEGAAPESLTESP